MIDDKEFCKAQIKRLAALEKFPAGNKEAIEDLVGAAQCFSTREASVRFFDDWIWYYTQAPKAAEIRRAAFADAEREYEMPSDTSADVCRACLPWGGYGWVRRPDGEFEACPNRLAHDAKAVAVLVDLMNANPRVNPKIPV